MIRFKKLLTGEAGFTLLEMLIAITIFAIMTSFIYFTLVTSENGARITIKSSLPYKEATNVFRSVHKTMLQFNSEEPLFIGSVDEINGKHFSSIYFTGFSHVSVPFNSKSSMENLNYFHVAREKKGKYYKLVYMESYFKNVKGSVSTELRKIIIARNISFFRVKYLSSTSGIWMNKYNFNLYQVPPSAVKIILGINAAAKKVKTFVYRFNM